MATLNFLYIFKSAHILEPPLDTAFIKSGCASTKEAGRPDTDGNTTKVRAFHFQFAPKLRGY